MELRPPHPLAATRLRLALRQRPPASRRKRRALGTHALAREAESWGAAGETFPRSFELSQFAEFCAHNQQKRIGEDRLPRMTD